MSRTGMRTAALFLGLGVLGCGGEASDRAPLRIEVLREKTKEGGEGALYCYVDRHDLEREGVDEAAVTEFVRREVEGRFREMISMALEPFFDPEPKHAQVPEPAPTLPAWAPQVFPGGIDLEIVEVDKNGTRKVRRGKHPVRRATEK